MRIDWTAGWWRFWSIDSGELLGRARTVNINIPVDLVNYNNNQHGWLIVHGVLQIRGDQAFIGE